MFSFKPEALNLGSI